MTHTEFKGEITEEIEHFDPAMWKAWKKGVRTGFPMDPRLAHFAYRQPRYYFSETLYVRELLRFTISFHPSRGRHSRRSPRSCDAMSLLPGSSRSPAQSQATICSSSYGRLTRLYSRRAPDGDAPRLNVNVDAFNR